MQEYIDNTIKITKTALSVTLEEVSLKYCDEEYMVITEVPAIDSINDKTFWIQIKEVVDYCDYNKLGSAFPLGEIVLQENFEQSSFRPDYYCSRPIQKFTGSKVLQKPAGTYAVLYHKSSYDTLKDAYKKLKDYTEEKKLKIKGNMYEQDQLYFLSESNPNDYLMKISVEVE